MERQRRVVVALVRGAAARQARIGQAQESSEQLGESAQLLEQMDDTAAAYLPTVVDG